MKCICGITPDERAHMHGDRPGFCVRRQGEELPPVEALVDGTYVMRFAHAISEEDADRIRHLWERGAQGRRLIVLGSGATLEPLPKPGQLDRIERKIDALLATLAEDEPEKPTHDMDGKAVPVVQREARSL